MAFDLHSDAGLLVRHWLTNCSAGANLWGISAGMEHFQGESLFIECRLQGWWFEGLTSKRPDIITLIRISSRISPYTPCNRRFRRGNREHLPVVRFAAGDFGFLSQGNRRKCSLSQTDAPKGQKHLGVTVCFVKLSLEENDDAPKLFQTKSLYYHHIYAAWSVSCIHKGAHENSQCINKCDDAMSDLHRENIAPTATAPKQLFPRTW